MSEHWPVKPLSEIAEVIMGQAPPGSDCNKDGIGSPFVKAGEFGTSRPIIREWTTNPKKFASRDDVLICVVGATCGKLNLGENCAIGRSVAAIRPNKSELNQFFLHYFMMQIVQKMRAASTGAAQTVISKKMIHEIRIPLPPLEEQQHIVSILDEALGDIANSIDNVQSVSNSVKELIETKLQKVFQENSSEWEKIPFEKSVVRVKATPKIKKRDFKESGTHPIISQEMDYINGYWNNADDLLTIQTPVIVFGDHSKTLKYIDFDFVRGADGLKVLQPIESILPKFFYHQLRSVKLETLGYARHYRLLKQTEIRVPTMELQHQIASMFDDLDEKVSQMNGLYERELQSFEELKQSILHEAFYGKLTG